MEWFIKLKSSIYLSGLPLLSLLPQTAAPTKGAHYYAQWDKAIYLSTTDSSGKGREREGGRTKWHRTLLRLAHSQPKQRGSESGKGIRKQSGQTNAQSSAHWHCKKCRGKWVGLTCLPLSSSPLLLLNSPMSMAENLCLSLSFSVSDYLSSPIHFFPFALEVHQSKL